MSCPGPKETTVGDMAEMHPPADKGMGFDDLADAPVGALGLSKAGADALAEALGVKTVRDLAGNKYVRRAQAIVNLADASK